MPRKLIQKTSVEQDEILKIVQHALESKQAVLFAYIYGSFLGELSFHDLDVAIYLDDEQEDLKDFVLDLGANLENELRSSGHQVPVDVQVLNHAPLSFRYQVFRGELLFSRNEILRVQVVENTIARYLDIKPLRHRAVKEAMTAWA